MKKLAFFLVVGSLLFSPLLSSAAELTSAQAATVGNLVTTLRGTPDKAVRKALIESAISADPAIAATLVAQLIAAFPDDAADNTTTVVQAVISSDIQVTAKSTILTEVAQSAVPAALQLPITNSTELVAKVNQVKAALAQVTSTNADFSAAVQAYVAPVTETSEEIIIAIQEQEGEAPIVSGQDVG